MPGLSGLSGLEGCPAVYGGLVAYLDRVLSLNPYWFCPQLETAGTTLEEIIANNDGQYSSNVAVMGNVPAPYGYTAPYLDGTDYADIYSVGLDGLLDGDEFTALVWFQFANNSYWTDGISHSVMRLYVDADNSFLFYKPAADTRLTVSYESNAVPFTETHVLTAPDTDWHCLVARVSRTAGSLRWWFDGVEQTSHVIAAGDPWAGALHANFCLLGASTKAPASTLVGATSMAALFGVLTPEECASLW